MAATRKRSSKIASLEASVGEKESQDQALYNLIFDAVLAQRLLPGTKLKEDELAEIFKVSRAIVRRALLRLSQDRIVDIRPNRGASVVCPSVKQAREILAARCMIEAAIVREVVAVASKAQIEELRILVGEEKHNFDHDMRGSGLRLSGDFHLKLAQLSDNATLIKFVKELIPQTSLIIAQYEKPGYVTCSHIEHFELIDVISSSDVDHAVALMQEHLQHIEDKLDLVESEPQKDLKQVFSHIVSPASNY